MLAHTILPMCRAAPSASLTVRCVCRGTASARLTQRSSSIKQTQVRYLYTPNDAVQKQGSYEGPGKTTVAILNEDSAGVINMVDSYAVDGFRLNDDTKILGPCVVFPTHVLGRH